MPNNIFDCKKSNYMTNAKGCQMQNYRKLIIIIIMAAAVL